MDYIQLYNQHQHILEDFWGRRNNAPTFERRERLFGRPLHIRSNQQAILQAVDYSLPLYSNGAPIDAPPFEITITVRPSPLSVGEPPSNLFAINHYVGFENWLSIQIGAWGNCHIDLKGGTAQVALTPELAAHPEIVSRGLLNTIFNNLLTGSGYCMLHCTGLLQNDRLLLLMAPHNTGKSTTALRLVMSGLQLVSDSQIYVSPDHDTLHLFGFPVGKGKLRRDMVPHFPQLQPHLTAEPVRDETKYALDLRTLNRDWVCEDAVTPQRIDLCLLTRNGREKTTLTSAELSDVWPAVVENSVFYDSAAAWNINLQQAARVVEQSTHWHLSIGTDPDHIIETIHQLFEM